MRYANPGLDPDTLRTLHERLLFPRMIEEKMLNLLRQGRLSKWFSGIGQEAISVGVASVLEAEDYILPMHRNLGIFTTRGVDLTQLICQLMGRGQGFTGGRDRSFHFGTLEHRIVGMISHLGAMLPVGCGLGLAQQLKGTQGLACAFTGDGATSEGDFHEALNLAAVWKLPVIFIIENNQYGLSTPVSEQYACERLSDRALGYGMPGETIDGNDILAVMDATKRAAKRARAGEGPTLIECMTFRMRGHEEASGIAYIPPALFEEWGARDPIKTFEARLLNDGTLKQEEIDALRERFKAQIQASVDEALEQEPPSSTPEAELKRVFAPLPTPPAVSPKGTRTLRYVDAIAEAMGQAMEADDRVLMLGQDIAEYGGAFKITDGFVERFGKARVRNTPIIESGAVGASMGLALEGFLPIMEMQFGDFVTCGFNQIVNNLAKTHYRWGAPIPVTVRMPVGGGMGAGPYHSQNPESWFTSVAGLKVVAPATPQDAKGLLLSAIYDPNPVIVLEHKFLYRSEKGEVEEAPTPIPIGVASVPREGADLTIITYGVGRRWALDAADTLAQEGSEVEVIDLRTLIPLDEEAILKSIQKTGRALILHEAPQTSGFGAEIAARISQLAFEYLDAPVTRLAALDTPVPFAKSLEAHFMPAERLLPACRALLSY